MPDTATTFPPSELPKWPLADKTFAAEQLAQEFPVVAKDRVIAAVNSAASLIRPIEGRVKLMRQARGFLRPP